MIHPYMVVPERDRATIEAMPWYWILAILPNVARAREMGPVLLISSPGRFPWMLNDRNGWTII